MSLTTEEVGSGRCDLSWRELLAVSACVGTGGPEEVM